MKKEIFFEVKVQHLTYLPCGLFPIEDSVLTIAAQNLFNVGYILE